MTFICAISTTISTGTRYRTRSTSSIATSQWAVFGSSSSRSSLTNMWRFVTSITTTWKIIKYIDFQNSSFFVNFVNCFGYKAQFLPMIALQNSYSGKHFPSLHWNVSGGQPFLPSDWQFASSSPRWQSLTPSHLPDLEIHFPDDLHLKKYINMLNLFSVKISSFGSLRRCY